MERRSFLRNAILAAGFIAIAPHLAFPKRLHEEEIEWFVYVKKHLIQKKVQGRNGTIKEHISEIVGVSAIYKGDQWASDPIVCEMGESDQGINICKEAIIREIKRHHDIPRGTLNPKK